MFGSTNETRVIEMDDDGHRLIINALNDKRNELVEQRRDTEFVDEVLLEVIDAPYRKPKHEREAR